MAARAAASLAAATVAVVMLLAGGAAAQSPSPSSQCTSALVSLSPCLNYISGNESTAPASCCTQLGKVVQSNPQCLCVALNADPASLGLSINRTRALGLPDACKVQTPPVSNCKSGAAAPASPTATPGSAGAGSKTTPAASADSGAASPRGAAGLAAGVVVAAAVLAGFAV
ncbi:hypothetical protein ACP4OV_012199 [Aristida adscensionis]